MNAKQTYLCPKCGKTTAEGETISLRDQGRSSGNGEHVIEISCLHCPNDGHSHIFERWQYEPMTYHGCLTPEDWSDDTQSYCGDRDRGVCVKVDADFYKGIVRSTSPGEWWDGRAKFFATVVSHKTIFIHPAERPLCEYVDSYEQALQMVSDAMWTAEMAKQEAIREQIEQWKATAQTRGFKAGWVWYRTKDEFGAEIANKYLPK